MGDRAAAGAVPAGAERKLVTVLLADVDEAVEDFAEPDPEDVGRMLAGSRKDSRGRAGVAGTGVASTGVAGGGAATGAGGCGVGSLTRSDDALRRLPAATQAVATAAMSA